MQVLLIVLVLGLFLHDAVVVDPVAPSAWIVLAVLLPKAVVALVYWIACRLALRAIGGGGTATALRRLERFTVLFRVAILAMYVADLSGGALVWLRATVGDPVLIDEALVLLPTLFLLAFGWWAYYPIDRRLREAELIRRADSGLPVYPIWSRGRYLATHLRHEVALILLPLLLILAWAEAANRFVPATWDFQGLQALPVIVFAGSGLIFLLSPMVIRYVWSTEPMPPGSVRDRLMAMCQLHRVGVRDVLLWRTAESGGGMINAAVMGLIAPLRYILLTDALLDQVREEHVEAVMAHELAHVRRHHMFWLLAAALAALGGAELIVRALLMTAGERWLAWDLPGSAMLLRDTSMLVVTTVFALGVWVIVFGWVSRRAERQADAFAVRHVAMRHGLDRIDGTSAATMIGALQMVARLNRLATTRHNWRHGSIAWRQAYLRTLVDRPVDDLPIDRVMWRIKAATIVVLAIVIAGMWWTG